MFTQAPSDIVQVRARLLPGIAATTGLSFFAMLANVTVDAATPFQVAHSIDVTNDQIVLVELKEALVDSNLFDLENTTISFVPNDQGEYSVERKGLQWDQAIGEEMEASILSTSPTVMANTYTLENFYFPFSGENFREILVSPNGLIAFDSAIYSGIMQRLYASSFRYDIGLKDISSVFYENTIAPLFWTYGHTDIPGTIHSSEGVDNVVFTFSVSEPCCDLDAFTTENNVNEYQVKLYSSGQIDISYRKIDSKMGVVGVFPKHDYGQGRLIQSNDFEESNDIDPQYDITNVSIHSSKDNRNLEFVYTFAGDLSEVTMAGSKNWYVTISVQYNFIPFGGPLISGGAPNLRVLGGNVVSEPIVRGNQLFVSLNFEQLNLRAGHIVEITSRAQEYANTPGDEVEFSFVYPELISRDSLTRNTDFSAEEISGVQSRVYEGFYHQADINTDWLMCDVISELGDLFTLGVHYSSFRLDNLAASSPVRSFNSPSKGIGIGFGFDTDPRDGPAHIGTCKSYDLQANLARVIPLDSVAGSSFGTTSHYYSAGLLTHEIGHNWIVAGLTATVGNETINLSRFGGHWRSNLHSPVAIKLTDREESSTMGGVHWRDNGNGTYSRFSSPLLESGFSYLDLYLIGLIPPENVPDFYVVKNFEFVARDSDGNSQYMVDKVDVTIEDVIAAHGPRFPTYLESPKDFNMAFTYVRPYGEQIDQEKLSTLRGIRDAFLERWCIATGGLSTIYSEVTGKYQSSRACELTTELGIGTEDPAYGVAYEWPDLNISDFASMEYATLGIRDRDLHEGDTFSAYVDMLGSGTVDIYVQFRLPGGTWITLGSDGSLSEPSEIIPFRRSHVLGGSVTQRFEIISVPLGYGADYHALPKGDYLMIIHVGFEGQLNVFSANTFVGRWSTRFRVN